MTVQHLYHEDPGYYGERAEGLLASAGDGTVGALAAFERHGVAVDSSGARTVIARDHGLPSWEALLAAVADLRASGAPFAAAYRAVEAHDADGLAAVLDEHPDLVGAAGTNGNDLLGMASATGSLRVVTLLLDRGADVGAANAHGWTALHQAAYANRSSLATLLLDRGASPASEGRGSGGTPLVVALFWGNRAVTEILLAAGGPVPDNLRMAAGIGDVAAIGRLAGTPQAGAARGFYRPHSGFGAWTPSDDPQEVLDEALSWAARNDRADALEALVTAGARLEADVYRGTALTWAAATGADAAVRRLIVLGANPSGRSTFGGPDHGEGITPLHIAAQSGNAATARLLLELGADRTPRDALYGGQPSDWAAHGGHPKLSEQLAA